jgi:hypothetical protein
MIYLELICGSLSLDRLDRVKKHKKPYYGSTEITLTKWTFVRYIRHLAATVIDERLKEG